MKKLIYSALLTAAFQGIRTGLMADTADITWGLNAPTIGAGGGARVHWGPMVSQSKMELSGNANAYYPKKYAKTSLTRTGGDDHCVGTTAPESGPGTIVPPSTVPVYEWFCNQASVPVAPVVNFE